MIALFSRNSLVVSLFALSSIMSCVWPERVVKYKTWLIFSDVNIWSRVIIGRCLLFIDLLFWVTGTLLPVLCLFLCRESWLVSVSIRLSVKQMIVYLLFTYVTSMCLAAHCLSVCLSVCLSACLSLENVGVTNLDPGWRVGKCVLYFLSSLRWFEICHRQYVFELDVAQIDWLSVELTMYRYTRVCQLSVEWRWVTVTVTVRCTLECVSWLLHATLSDSDSDSDSEMYTRVCQLTVARHVEWQWQWQWDVH